MERPAARRCGAIRAKAVDRRTTLLLLRFRYHIIQTQNNIERTLLAEDCRLLAFSGSPQNAVWLEDKEKFLDGGFGLERYKKLLAQLAALPIIAEPIVIYYPHIPISSGFITVKRKSRLIRDS